MEARSYTSFRKGRKLLAEKKRRNRINECLEEIKTLICKDSLSHKMDLDINKMEKAEILESAVEFIKKTKHSSPSSPTENQLKYQNGFTRCLQEMTSFLHGATDVSETVKYRLVQHVTRNIQPTNYNRNMNYLQHTGIDGQYLPGSENMNYVKYNPSLAVPLDRHVYCQNIKTETAADCNNNNNNNNSDVNNNCSDNSDNVWRPW